MVDDSAGFSSGRLDLRFTNRFDQPITLIGRFSGLPIRGLTLQPAELTLRAEPGKSSTLTVDLQFAERISFAQLAGTTFTAQLRSEGEPTSQSLQMAVVVHDVDEAGQDAARVVWRGTADFDRRNANYGHFAPSD